MKATTERIKYGIALFMYGLITIFSLMFISEDGSFLYTISIYIALSLILPLLLTLWIINVRNNLNINKRLFNLANGFIILWVLINFIINFYRYGAMALLAIIPSLMFLPIMWLILYIIAQFLKRSIMNRKGLPV